MEKKGDELVVDQAIHGAERTRVSVAIVGGSFSPQNGVMTSSLEIGMGRVAYRVVMGTARRALGLRKKTVSLGGTLVPVFVRKGSGVPIVLVHGFGADKEGWLGLVAHLRGLPIVALDLPGFGAASAIDPALATAEHQAKALKGVLDALSISKAVVVGSSMGGAISLRFASDFPDVVEGLVLLGSVG
ncbi:MAG TPA: alpha/beta fold hydrolase, partial [Polyangiaceae bacterium]